MAIRVLIADDEPLIRAGIRLLLSTAPDIEVVAEAGDGREALRLVGEHRPDLVLMDIRMPVMDGLAAVAELARREPGVRAVMLTTFGERENVVRALGSGVAGFLLKDTAPAEMIAAVRAAAAGSAFLSPVAARHVVAAMADGGAAGRAERAGRAARERVAGLTDREREVLGLLGQGLANAEIGSRLFMSESTVKTHVSRILEKLGCGNRVQAALLAREAGMG